MVHDESSLDDSHIGIGGAARACDFWRGLGREGDGTGSLKTLAGTGGMDIGDNGNDGDDSDGGGDFGGDFEGPEDDFEEERTRNDVRTLDNIVYIFLDVGAGGCGLMVSFDSSTILYLC